MRRFRIMGLALVAVLALSAIAAGSASAKAKTLVINEREESAPLGSGGEVFLGLTMEFASLSGTITCHESGEGHLTTNSARADVYTNETGNMRCTGAAEGEASPGISGVTFKANGRAKLNGLTFGVRWPAFKSCTYTAPHLKGTNTLSGLLEARFEGNMRGHSCPEKVIHVTASENNPWVIDGPNIEELESQVL
jgi:hypothetical protein